jgi:hypothetical protein
MPYVLQRIPDGAFVCRSGLGASYSRLLQHAKLFDTRAQAEAERCPENERIRDVEAIMRGE